MFVLNIEYREGETSTSYIYPVQSLSQLSHYFVKSETSRRQYSNLWVVKFCTIVQCSHWVVFGTVTYRVKDLKSEEIIVGNASLYKKSAIILAFKLI